MKKFTLLLLLILPFLGFGQTFDFKNAVDNDELGWIKTGGASSMTNTNGLGSAIEWIADKKPKIRLNPANVDASTNKFMAITLINNSSEAVELQVFHDNGTDTRFYLYPTSLETSVSTPTTYLVNLTNALWTGTMSQFDIIFKGAGNTNLANASSAGSIIIQKIDFIPAEAIKDTYLFNSGTNKEGWIVDSAVSNNVSSGVMTLVPTAGSASKIIQDEFKLDPASHSHIHITYKNVSAANNQFRIQWILSEGPVVRKGANISISSNMTDYETITYDLTGNKGTDWTDALATGFQIIIRDTNNGNNASAGNLLIQSIVFNNSATPPNIFSSETSSDWATATNWSLAEVPAALSSNPINDVVTIPTNTNDVVISGTTGAEVTDLNVDSGATLTIASGGSLIVNGASSGNVSYKRELSFTSGGLEGWHLVSAPVAGQGFDDAYITANDIASGSGNNRGIATYNNAVTSGNWVYHQAGASSSFATSTGYAMKRGTTTGDVTFTGTINTTDVNAAITVGAGTAFNLIGNPYTAYVNSATVLSDNTALLTSQTIWVWNPATKNYDTKVTGDAFKVAPGQGFFVEAASSNNVVIAEGTQSHETDTFLRTSITDPEVVINIFDGDLTRYAKVRYQNSSSLGFDNGYDGKTFSGLANELDVFTHLLDNNEGTKYQIQSLPNSNYENMVIPVGVNAAAGSDITFTAEAFNLPTGYAVYLEDRTNSSFKRLDEANAEYTVNIEAGNTIGRFYLHTTSSALSVNDNSIVSNLQIYTTASPRELIVKGQLSGATITDLYDLQGRLVISKKLDQYSNKSTIDISSLSTGIYVVKVDSGNQTKTQKVIIR